MCIITHNNVNPHGAEPANAYEANAELQNYQLYFKGLWVLKLTLLCFSRTTCKFIHLHLSDQTRKATECCCLEYEI